MYSILGCGVQNENRIGGGVESDGIPWQVRVIAHSIIGNSLHRHVCGGTIIGEKIVLTAAHCHASWVFDVEGYHHVLANDLQVQDWRKVGYKVCNKITHEKYESNCASLGCCDQTKPLGVYYDFQILALDKPFQFNENIIPACLPSPNMDDNFLDGKTLTASGWGRTYTSSPQSEQD